MEYFSIGADLDTYISSYEVLIHHIITVYLPGIVTICRIFGSPNGVVSDVKIPSSIPTVSFTLNERPQIDSSSNPLLSGIELGCDMFIVHQDSIISYMDQYIQCHDEASYRSSEKLILLLMDGAQSGEPNLLEKLRKHPNLVEVMNLLILKPTANMSSIELLTHRFVGTAEESTELFLLDIFDTAKQTFHHRNHLFPDKSTNLRGKFIRVATFNIPPITMLRKSESCHPLVKSGSQMYQLYGNDGLLMTEFCRRYNCSVELILDEVNMFGTIYSNKTGNGILGSLVERRADVGFGGLSSWHGPLRYLAFSKPIQRNSITCITPKPVHEPTWKVMLIAFSVPVWISTIVVFFIIVFMHFLSDRLNQSNIIRKDFGRSCLNLLAIFLLQTANFRMRKVSDVILSMALLNYAFNLVSIYSSKNASLRTVPLFGPSIDTIDDLARSGITWMQTHEAWVFSLLLSENPTIMKLLSRFQTQPSSVLREYADQGNVSFAIGQLNDDHLMLGEWITAGNVHKYQVMREILYYEYEISMATKTWPLMERFSTLTMRTSEARIRNYQELNAIFETTDYYVQRAATNSRLREPYTPRAFNLNDLFGGFFVLGLGLIAAMIGFAIEICTIKLKASIQWWYTWNHYNHRPFFNSQK